MNVPKTLRILIIEDSSVMRTQIKMHLRKLGFKDVFEAATGLEGIMMLVRSRTSNQPIDIVISDWEMPELTGLEFFRMVRAVPAWESLPVIFLTSFSGADEVIYAARAGIENYLIKPATSENLIEKLEIAYNKMMTKTKTNVVKIGSI